MADVFVGDKAVVTPASGDKVLLVKDGAVKLAAVEGLPSASGVPSDIAALDTRLDTAEADIAALESATAFSGMSGSTALASVLGLTGAGATNRRTLANLTTDLLATAGVLAAFGIGLASDATAMVRMGLAVDIKSFGAVGDGTTNDTAAIVTAHAAIGAAGLYYSPGTYLVTSWQFTGKTDRFIIGRDAIIKHTGASNPHSTNKSSNAWADFSANTRCKISGLQFLGVAGSGAMLNVYDNDHCEISYCKFSGISSATGFITSNKNTDCRYLYNNIDGDANTSSSGCGMSLGHTNNSYDLEIRATAKGNEIQRTWQSGLQICGIDCTIEKNYVHHVGSRSTVGAGIIITGGTNSDQSTTSRNVKISKNTCNSNAWHGIQEDGVDAGFIENTQIIGNTCNENLLFGIYCRQSTRSRVAENILRGNVGGGINITENAKSTLVENNTVALGDDGILVSCTNSTYPPEDICVRGNNIYNNASYNMRLVQSNSCPADNIRFENNILSRGSGNGYHWRVIETNAGSVTNCKLTNNSIDGTVTYGVYNPSEGVKLDGAQYVIAAKIGSAANAINTTNKRIAKRIANTDNSLILEASGTTATSPWVYEDGSGSITPS